MKKRIALCLVLVLLLTCAACGNVQDTLDGLAEQVGQEVNKELARGTIAGNVYTSEFVDMTFTKPETWTFATDEEIAQTMKIGMALMKDPNAYQKAISKMATIFDMMVIDSATGTNISILYENLAVTGNTGMHEDAYIEATKSLLQAQVNAEYVFGETSDIELSGDAYRRMSFIATYDGVQMEQIYYVRAMDKYMHVIILTLVNGVTAADVEAMFS